MASLGYLGGGNSRSWGCDRSRLRCWDRSCWGSGGGSISASGGGSVIVILGSVDGDLDSDGTTSDLLALESFNGLLLLLLATNIDKAVTLRASGMAPAFTDDAGRNDVDACLGEETSQASIVNVEAKVGNEKHGLGRFTSGVLTSRTRWAGLPGFPNTRLLFGSFFCSCFTIDNRCSYSIRGLSIGSLGLSLALKKEGMINTHTNT
jgi:hypothetical protein